MRSFLGRVEPWRVRGQRGPAGLAGADREEAAGQPLQIEGEVLPGHVGAGERDCPFRRPIRLLPLRAPMQPGRERHHRRRAPGEGDLRPQVVRPGKCSVTCRSSSSSRAREAASTVRTVPVSIARSGMTLSASPAWIVATVTTPGMPGSRRARDQGLEGADQRRGAYDWTSRFVRTGAVRAGPDGARSRRNQRMQRSALVHDTRLMS